MRIRNVLSMLALSVLATACGTAQAADNTPPCEYTSAVQEWTDAFGPFVQDARNMLDERREDLRNSSKTDTAAYKRAMIDVRNAQREVVRRDSVSRHNWNTMQVHAMRADTLLGQAGCGNRKVSGASVPEKKQRNP